MLDATTGKLSVINDRNVYGGFSDASYDLAWSPDSKWIAYPRSLENHLHALFLYSVDSGKSTQMTGLMADARLPAFDRGGKFLYYTASTNAGANSDGLDMSSDLYAVRSNIYAVVLSVDQASPIAPELDDEKVPGTKQAKPKEPDEGAPADEVSAAKPLKSTSTAIGSAPLAALRAPPPAVSASHLSPTVRWGVGS
jgi:tricorn protease